jgi:formiminoglutamase
MRVSPPVWTGRTDNSGPRFHHLVNAATKSDPFHLLGLASDEGVARNQGRIGAAAGPAALRAALANLAAVAPLHDLGDVAVDGTNLEDAQALYADIAAETLTHKSKLIGIGGGHEIAFASFLALKQAFPKDRIGILNFDAHFDLRDEPRRNSGTSFLDALRQGADAYHVVGISRPNNAGGLFQTASEYGVSFHEDHEVQPSITSELIDWAQRFDHLYVTVCLDVFPASEAPGVSAPAAYGVPLRLLTPLLSAVAMLPNHRLFDIAELNPNYDIDGHTARLAARLIYHVLEAWTL